MATVSERIRTAMDLCGLKQIDVITRAKAYYEETGEKLNKSDLSQYLSGKVIPGAAKAAILGDILGVNALWLRGISDDMEPPKRSSRLSRHQELEFEKAGFAIRPLFSSEDDAFWDLTDSGIPPEIKFSVVDTATGEQVICYKDQIDSAFQSRLTPTALFNRFLRAKDNKQHEDAEYLSILQRPECHKLFDMARDSSKEEVEQTIAILSALRGLSSK